MFNRLGSHPIIVKVLHIHEGMIVLKRLQHPLCKRALGFTCYWRTTSLAERCSTRQKMLPLVHVGHCQDLLEDPKDPSDNGIACSSEQWRYAPSFLGSLHYL